jgi:undecaprenyl-diphosphatase
MFETIQAWDEAILASGRGSPGWAVPVFYVLTMIGGGWGLLVLLPFILRRTSRVGALWLGGSVISVSILVSMIKPLVGRLRPCDALGWCSAIAVSSPGGHSFPSGHAAGSFAFGTFVALRIPKLGVPALLLSTLIAWSRCMLGVHYPSDVLGGAVLGTAFGVGFAYAARRMAASAMSAGVGGAGGKTETEAGSEG